MNAEAPAVPGTARPDGHGLPAPNAPRPGGLAHAPVLFLYSGDDTLLIELGPVLGTRYRTRPIESIDELAPPAGGAWALLIDATARADARAQAARARQQYPQAPIVVVCADGAAGDWASPLARGAVCAVVERGALAGPGFAAALAELDAQLRTAPGALDLAVPGMDRGTPPWRRLAPWICVTLALAAGAWYFSARTSAPARGSPTAATGTPAPALAPAPAPAAASHDVAPDGRSVLELLSDARVAFGEERRQLPADGATSGDNALELYARVLALDPQNDEARDGMRRLYAVASARVHADLAAGRFDDAARLLAALQGRGIADDALTAQQAELAATRQRALAAQARAQQLQALETTQPDAQLVTLARQVHAAINAGGLLEPASSLEPPASAQALVQQMEQLDRASPLTATARQELQAALAERARVQQEAANAARARAAATSAAPDVATIGAAPGTTAGSATAPAAAPAAVASPSSGGGAAQFLAARPLAPLEVSYPQRALDAHQQGYVVVEFTLNADGHASEPRVVESSPPSVFDSAALQAVRHGRFDAGVLGRPAQPQRARLRISFK
jgi:protein TonB